MVEKSDRWSRKQRLGEGEDVNLTWDLVTLIGPAGQVEILSLCPYVELLNSKRRDTIPN